MVQNSNYAFGDVGAQIGTVQGNLTFDSQSKSVPPAPRDPVDDLILAVLSIHQAGGMDTGTLEPAMRVLAELRGLLAGSAPQDPDRLDDAVRRLATVLGGFPELRARAAALTAWRGER